MKLMMLTVTNKNTIEKIKNMIIVVTSLKINFIKRIKILFLGSSTEL